MTSADLLHWKHQPIALAPDQPYDCGGVFSGSATIYSDTPVLLYSVKCGESVAVALPANMADPLLVNWTKPAYNPVIQLPPNVTGGFRDPTTAWQGADNVWRLLVGCGDGEGTCMFKSTNFVNWSYVGPFHSHGGGSEPHAPPPRPHPARRHPLDPTPLAATPPLVATPSTPSPRSQPACPTHQRDTGSQWDTGSKRDMGSLQIPADPCRSQRILADPY